mgnify:CR=1 FL=1
MCRLARAPTDTELLLLLGGGFPRIVRVLQLATTVERPS